ncbi:MAG: helix-turn-helix transcriptional regulator [Acidobacteria bacterium]|nr:helix-turn-helix transcriptional regulator [Acidobacteriota bacterium]
MRYAEFPVDPAVQHLIVNYWTFAVDERDPEVFEHTIVPDGTCTVGYSRYGANVGGMATFLGPRVTAAKVSVVAGGKYCGFRLHPSAGGAALRVPMVSLRDQFGLLSDVRPWLATRIVEEVAGAESDEETVAGLSRVTSELATVAHPIDELVAQAVQAIIDTDGSERIVDTATRVGLGERQFQRRFRAAVGLTPKEFARMRRIRHACLLALMGPDPTWAGVSTDAGFADQAHLTREFGGVFGWSPRLLMAYLERIEHTSVV